MSTLQELIKLKNVNKSYQQGIPLFKDLNLDILKEDFVVFIGPSGCGKSTLLRILSGIEFPDQGESIVSSTSKAFVFQSPTLLPWRNVIDNVILPFELSSQQSHNLDEEPKVVAEKWLKNLKLLDRAQSFPHELSGGMQMRVSLARAFTMQPELIFFDEPLSALEEPSREQLQYEIRKLWSEQKGTYIWVTHSIDEAVYLGNKIFFLKTGNTGQPRHEIIRLPKLRDKNLRQSAEFMMETRRIRQILESEALS